jgi:hypothetical protein
MKDPENEVKRVRLHDYGVALQSAVSWLGDRYLLAAPQARRDDVRPIYLKESAPKPRPPAANRQAGRRVN